MSKMNPRLKSLLVFCLKLVVTAVPAYFVYRNIVKAPDWSVDDLYSLFSTHSVWPLFVAVLCLGLSNFTACLQWKLLLEKQDVKLGYGHLLKLYYVGLFFNNFMPGNVGGDAKKVYDIRMQGGQDTVGAGLTAETEAAVRWLVRTYEGTLILDADALNALAKAGPDLLLEAKGRTLLTPHLGEFSRLSGLEIDTIRQEPEAIAERFAKDHHTTVLLKGPVTTVTDGTETLRVDRGCPGMATAGSGDVLSGILAAIAGAHPEQPLAAVAAAGAWINGRAGEIAQQRHGDVSMISSDTAGAVEEAIRELRQEG